MNDYYLRTQFIEKIIAFLIKYGFTGLDCDIEFPGYYQVRQQNIEIFERDEK